MTDGSDAVIQQWMWMLPIAFAFMLGPFLIIKPSWETIAVWFCAAVGVKWFLFGIADWAENTKSGQRLTEWTQG